MPRFKSLIVIFSIILAFIKGFLMGKRKENNKSLEEENKALKLREKISNEIAEGDTQKIKKDLEKWIK